MRFRQCMTRAISLVRVYFINSLKEVSHDINQRISAKVASPLNTLTEGNERNYTISIIIC